MPLPCSLCNHADREAMDAALDDEVSVSEVVRRSGVSRASVRRHREHRDAKPGKGAEGPRAELHAATSELRALCSRVLGLLDRAP